MTYDEILDFSECKFHADSTTRLLNKLGFDLLDKDLDNCQGLHAQSTAKINCGGNIDISASNEGTFTEPIRE